MKTTAFSLALLQAGCAYAQTSVSADVFGQIQKYTAFAAAAYAEVCPTPPSGASIVQFINDTVTDTQAYVFQLGSEKILSFRGSSSPKDLDVDFNFTLTQVTIPGVSCDACQVHSGFQYSFNAVYSAIQSALDGATGSSLTITGHSLGGGLAAMAAVALKPGKVFTFGEPRNGNAAWSALVDQTVAPANYFRVTHFNDGVPQIPPPSFNYVHHGTEYWESLSTSNNAASTKQCAAPTGSENPNCNNGQDFGAAPINGAHIQYTNMYLASMLFNPGCGFKVPAKGK